MYVQDHRSHDVASIHEQQFFVKNVSRGKSALDFAATGIRR